MPAMRQPRGKLKNCKACFKVFVSMRGEEYCPHCLPLEQEKERKVREYLREHPGAPAIDVIREAKLSKNMGESHEVEDYMYNEGFIEGVPKQNVCASCGKPIRDGITYCPTCFQVWMHTIKQKIDYPEVLMTHAPHDPDRAAPIDVATLRYSAASAGARINHPHGPGQNHSIEDKHKAQHYLGIIGETRRAKKR